MSAIAVKKRGRGRGRPAFVPTPSMRDRVKTCKAAGMTHEELAIGLGISRETLEKYFEFELGQGASDRKQEALERLWKLGQKGNVSALKAYLSKVKDDPHTLPPPDERLTDQPQAGAAQPGVPAETAAPEGDAKPEKIGKKEQQQKDAVTAHVGTDWADLLKPTARPQ